MNKLLFKILAALLLITSSVQAQRETQFFTSFEYGSFEDEPEAFVDPAELNGADGQIGEWSGEDLPDAVNDGSAFLDEGIAGGFKNNPYDGGRLLAIDRPGPAPDGNFKGSIDANLADPVLLLGAEISFQIGVRRTGGNPNKDFDIVGLDSDGTESFRVRVGTNNNGGERLGYVTNDGADVVFDLPTVIGDDTGADLNNTGYNATLVGPYDDLGGPGVNAEFPDIKLSLGAEGFVIDLAHDPLNTSVEANAYTSATLPYNGNAADLAVVQFGYSGASGTGANSGWFLDNILVSGFQEFIQGDFDNSGALDFADFLILSNNFGEQTSEGDYNFDGIVNLSDFAQLKAAFASQGAGAAVAASAVPEPASVTLGLLAVLMGLSFRKRR